MDYENDYPDLTDLQKKIYLARYLDFLFDENASDDLLMEMYNFCITRPHGNFRGSLYSFFYHYLNEKYFPKIKDIGDFFEISEMNRSKKILRLFHFDENAINEMMNYPEIISDRNFGRMSETGRYVPGNCNIGNAILLFIYETYNPHLYSFSPSDDEIFESDSSDESDSSCDESDSSCDEADLKR
jgi:hypothetical protein